MRRFLLIAAAGLGLAWGAGALPAQDAKDILNKVDCSGDFGTACKFVKTPSDAAKQARKEEKLVLVLHVSGNFEDPEFT